MNRRRQSFAMLCALALGLVLAPIAAFAQAAGLTADQVRTAFMRVGYEADQPLTWDWLSPPLTSFHVYDQRLGRVLRVQVYPDVESVRTARLPHAAPGYGPTVWFRNVALAAASDDELARLADTELQREMCVADPPLPTDAVSLQEPVPGADLVGLLGGVSTVEQ